MEYISYILAIPGMTFLSDTMAKFGIFFFLWASLFNLVGGYIHEFCHLSAAKYFGIKNGKILFRPLKNSKIPLPLFHIFIEDEDLEKLAISERRIVFIAGVAADIFVGLIAAMYLYWVPLTNSFEAGAVLVLALRFVTTWSNLIPIQSIRSDGWRILNPHDVK